MKSFYSRNKKVLEIILTLALVFLTGGYYYAIYIPHREEEITARRFRNLQRIETNTHEKFQGYLSTIKNCASLASETDDAGQFPKILNFYNREPDKFNIAIIKDTFYKKEAEGGISLPFDTLLESLKDKQYFWFTVKSNFFGRKLTINYYWYNQDKNDSNCIRYLEIKATIDYKEFISPLLRKDIFDHYIVFNVADSKINGDYSSGIIYETFPSGISFRDLDSLFDAKEKVYSSRIIKIETGGEKYLAFLHPCGYNNKNDRIIVGLLKQETFDKEKRHLPENMVTTFLFIALFTFLLLPVLRLALLGKKERIVYFDLFTGYFSFLLLVPVIILMFFWNRDYFFPDGQRKDISKNELAEQISTSLKNEIDTTCFLLNKFDLLHSTPSLNNLYYTNIKYLFHANQVCSPGDYPDKKDTSGVADEIDTLKIYLKNIDSTQLSNRYWAFWMDSTGDEIANWAFEKDPPRGNYKERDYFKHVDQSNFHLVDSGKSKDYFLDPIISWVDGKFKVAVSMRSSDTTLVAALSSRFISVMNPVLPTGYSFAITDAGGNNIFDSDTTDNLNENLLEAFEDSTAFKTVLKTKSPKEFTANFEESEFNVLARPIPGLPYFIVIFEDKSFDSSLNIQSFSFTMAMMFSLFLFLCFEILVILFAHYNQSKLQKNNFDLSWIFPRKKLSYRYFSLFIFNCAVLIVLALFCFIDFSIHRLTEYIFLFMMAVLITSIAAFKFNPAKTKFENDSIRKNTNHTIVALLILAVIVLFSSIHYSVNKVNLLLFTAILTALFYLFENDYLLKYKENNEATLKQKSPYYLLWFRLMIFSKLLITSGLPVIVFFICIYNFELRLQERSKLLNYAEQIDARSQSGDNPDLIVRNINNKHAVNVLYTDTNWINKISYTKCNCFNLDYKYTHEDSICINLLKTSRLHYNDVSNSTENFEILHSYANDTAQFYFNSVLCNEVSNIKYKPSENKYLTLSSSAFNQFHSPVIFHSFGESIFWILLSLTLLGCFLILIYATDKIFGVYIPETKGFHFNPASLLNDHHKKYLYVQRISGADKTNFIRRNLKSKLAENKLSFHFNPEDLLNDSEIKYLFVQGIPGSNKLSFVKKNLTYKDPVIFNLSEIPDKEDFAREEELILKQADADHHEKQNWFQVKLDELIEVSKNKVVVFTHFEHKIHDEHTNRVKLNLIEKVIQKAKGKIIITSDIDPVEYLYNLRKYMHSSPLNKKTESKKESKEPGKEQDALAAYMESLNRWNNLLGKFTNIYAENELFNEAEKDSPGTLKNILYKESGHPSFLKGYNNLFKDLNDKYEKWNEEDVILKIQSLSDHSYRHIWSSLTNEEQLTLYDLAEDGLMNTTNYITVSMLLNKGLVLKDDDGVLKIINKSFRNFILTVINAEDIKNIEKEINDSKTWNDYKYPLFIILGALLYFVLSSNPEKFGNVLPIISGVMAGIPTILQLLSYFKPKGQ